MGKTAIRLAAWATAAVLGGCGSDRGDITIDGVAATGAALSGSAVSAKCSIGSPVAGTTDATGYFKLNLDSAAAVPCIVRVTAGGNTFYGFAASLGRVNVTPVTTLILARALGADPASAYATFDAATQARIASNLAAATTSVVDSVSKLAGIAPTANPISGALQVGDRNDQVLDRLAAALQAANSSYTVLNAAAAQGTSLAAALGPEPTRLQDSRTFAAPTPSPTTFAALAADTSDVVDVSTTSRWAGIMASGAAYRIEVPANWNGKLVMFAHGYAGTGAVLAAQNPPIRRHLIQQGYAWAASSYTKNYYDVRIGVEDTNALANAFTTLAQANGRPLAAPTRVYITGTSMGGHVAAAAIEDETYLTANNKVRYHGAMHMCGPVGDMELFNGIAAMQMVAQALTGTPNTPLSGWAGVAPTVIPALFSTYPTVPGLGVPMTPTSSLGAQYVSAIENMTGGDRPLFDMAIKVGGSLSLPMRSFGGDGTIDGIFDSSVVDTNRFTYSITGNPTATAALNASVQKITAPATANRLRRDGLRWVPRVNGEFHIPVVSIHTLGDLYVPFSMQQLYRQRAVANGNGEWLVQRSIRGITHCDFTVAEMVDAFEAMARWERDGVKPAGDDVLTPATVAAHTYGCTHTKNTLGPDEFAWTRPLRPAVVAAAACPTN